MEPIKAARRLRSDIKDKWENLGSDEFVKHPRCDYIERPVLIIMQSEKPELDLSN